MKKVLTIAIAGIAALGLVACNAEEKPAGGDDAKSTSAPGDTSDTKGSSSSEPKGSSSSTGRYVDG